MTSSIQQYEHRQKFATDPIWVMEYISNKFLENRDDFDGNFSNANKEIIQFY